MAQINGYKEELQDELQKTDPNSHASRLLTQEIDRLEKGEDRKDAKALPFVDVHPAEPQQVNLKIRIPINDFPKFNFVGKLLGPKGNTLKRLQEETGCKMAILGKGSMRDKVKEEELRKEGGHKFNHLNDELHVYVEAFAESTDAYRRVAHAVGELKKFLIPEGNDDIRQQQLQEMMYLTTGDAPPHPRDGGRGGYRGIPGRGGPAGRGAPPPGRGAPRGGGAPPPRGAPRGGAPPRGAPRGAGGAPPMRGAPRGRGGGGGAPPPAAPSYDEYGYGGSSGGYGGSTGGYGSSAGGYGGSSRGGGSSGGGGGGGYEESYDNRGGYGDSSYSGGQSLFDFSEGQYYGSSSYGTGAQSSAGYEDYSSYDYGHGGGESWGSNNGSGGGPMKPSRGGAKPRSHPYSGGRGGY